MAKTKNKIDKIILEAVEYLKQYFNVKEVILFGSQLKGKVSKFSDVDLAVISNDFKKRRFEDLVTIFAKISLLCNNTIEIHPYSLDDLKRARPSNFLGQIIKIGRIIYRAE